MSANDELPTRVAASAEIGISVVVPVYAGVECIDELYRRLVRVLESTVEGFEIVLVEDNGPDASWAAIQRLSETDGRVRGAQLSRNFGQHHAILAGLSMARGDYIVVMDCDLQDAPEAIADLYAKAVEGNDIVLAQRQERTDGLRKRLGSFLFYGTFNYFTGLDYDGSVGNFSIISRRVKDAVLALPEAVRFYGAQLRWLGFQTTKVSVPHAERFAGKSSYTLLKLFRLAMPIILAFSSKPLRLVIGAGFILSTMSFLSAAYLVIRALLFGTPVLGWPSLIVSIFFSTGLIVFTLGVLGLYIDRILVEVQRRPHFIIARTTFD